MIQLRDGTNAPKQLLLARLIVFDTRIQSDRDATVQHRIISEVQRSQAAVTKFLFNDVFANGLAGFIQVRLMILSTLRND